MSDSTAESCPFSQGSAAALSALALPRLRAMLAEQLAPLCQMPEINTPRRILLSGSGDSLFAAQAAAPALRRWSGLPVQVLTALEFARYEVPLLSSDDLVIGVSNSGSSSRTREAITLANAQGALTLGITGSLKGPLAALAQQVLHRPVLEPEHLPEHYQRVFLNMSEYLATLLALYELGLSLGQTRGVLRPQEVQHWRDATDTALQALPSVARELEPHTQALATELAGLDTLWILGAGPSRGSAEYAAAKCHEQFPLNGIPQDLEEWAHLQYFLTLSWGTRGAVMVLSPPGNSLDRAGEILTGIRHAGGRGILVSHPQVRGVEDATWQLPVNTHVDELLSPILYHLPAQLLVLCLAAQAGVENLPLRRQDDYWLIRGGLIQPDPQGLR